MKRYKFVRVGDLWGFVSGKVFLDVKGVHLFNSWKSFKHPKRDELKHLCPYAPKERKKEIILETKEERIAYVNDKLKEWAKPIALLGLRHRKLKEKSQNRTAVSALEFLNSISPLFESWLRIRSQVSESTWDTYALGLFEKMPEELEISSVGKNIIKQWRQRPGGLK